MKLENVFQLDAAEIAFFEKELEKVKAKSYDVKYPERNARVIIPTSFDAGAGTEVIKYNQYDRVGMVKIISDYAGDFERCDVKGKEFFGNVKSLGAAYGYNIQEIRASAMANKALEQRRANATRQAFLDGEHYLALFGDEDFNLQGFFTNPNVPEFTVPNDGAGASTLWDDKTADQIIRDINMCIRYPYVNTKGVEQSTNMLLLPQKHYALIETMPRSTHSDTTILEFVKKVNPGLTVIGMWELDADQNDEIDSSFMFAYECNPDKVTLEIPVEFEQFPPQAKALEYVVHCHQRFGGVIWYYPFSAAKADGI